MLNAYPDTFTFVQIHLDDYWISWGASRANFYDIEYTPTTWFDGVIERVTPYSFAIYEGFYNTRRAVSTDVTIDMTAEYVGGRKFTVQANVCIEGGGTGKTMRIHMVQVLDYWPDVVSYSRNGLKQAASYEDITLLAGECEAVEKDFTFDDDSWDNKDNIKIIAWAQIPNASGPAEVHQAAVLDWPLVQIKGDFDNNVDVYIDDFQSFPDCMAGPGATPSPTLTTPEKCLEVFDFDTDEDVDAVDFASFQDVMRVPGVIYVDVDATGADTGESWTDAYADLQDGLAAALPDDQVWIAEGMYHPAGPGGDRSISFKPGDGVALRGGFVGVETALDERDLAAHETILSGDLDDDDTPGFGTNGENSYHVLITSKASPTTILDGLIIEGGNANGTDDANRGGGIFNGGGSPTIVNCTLRGNYARSKGGGMHTREGGSPTLVNCVIAGNRTEISNGGGLQFFQSTANLTNCTVVGNTAYTCGGVFMNQTTSSLVNCIFWGNTDSGGSTEAAQLTDITYTPTIDYSCVEHWSSTYGGTGNTGDDPGLVDAAGADGVVGTADDDLHLGAGSLVVDRADGDAVPADTADIDGDLDKTEQVPWDRDGNARIVDDPIAPNTGAGTEPYVDMGAYEY